MCGLPARLSTLCSWLQWKIQDPHVLHLKSEEMQSPCLELEKSLWGSGSSVILSFLIESEELFDKFVDKMMSREAFIETSSTYIHVDPVNWAWRRPEATCCFDHFQAATDGWRLLLTTHFEIFELVVFHVRLIRFGPGLGGCPAEGWSWSAMAAEGVGGGGTLNFMRKLVKLLGFWCENDSKWSRSSAPKMRN